MPITEAEWGFVCHGLNPKCPNYASGLGLCKFSSCVCVGSIKSRGRQHVVSNEYLMRVCRMRGFQEIFCLFKGGLPFTVVPFVVPS